MDEQVKIKVLTHRLHLKMNSRFLFLINSINYYYTIYLHMYKRRYQFLLTTILMKKRKYN